MHKNKNLENSKCDVSKKLLTLDEAIAHAEECVDDTPCGQNHKQLAEWLIELDRLRTTPIGDIYALRQALVKAHTMLKVCDWPEGVRMKGVADLMKEIESAIDAPARNCSRFGTAKEADAAYHRFYECEIAKIPMDAVDLSRERAKIPTKDEWLFATATEKKGETDGSK